MYNQLKKTIAVVLALLTVFLMSVFSTAVTATIFGKPEFTATSNDLKTRFGNLTNLYIKNEHNLKVDDISIPKDIAVVVDNSLGGGKSPFNFAVVANDVINIAGSSINITGDVHSNNSIFLGPSYGSLNINEGTLSSTGMITVFNGQSVNKIEKAAHVDLKELPLEPAVRNITISAGGALKADINDDSDKKGEEFRTNPTVAVNSKDGSYYYQTIGSLPLTINTNDTTVYFKDYSVMLDGAKLKGKNQWIVADKDIIVQSGTLESTDAVLYTENGNIDIGPGKVEFKGIIYAPKGTVNIHASSGHITGSIVANKVNFNAQNVIISHDNSSDGVTDHLSDTTASSDLSKAKDFIKSLLSSQQNNNVRMTVIPCNFSADNTVAYNLTNTIAGGNAIVKTIDDLNPQNNGIFNLGDGLRRAYKLLTSSVNNNLKYIIVLGYNAPNAYTTKGGKYQTDDANADTYSVESTSSASPEGYANNIASLIKDNNICPIFINYSGKGDTDSGFTILNNVAKNAGAAQSYNTSAESLNGMLLSDVESQLSVLPINNKFAGEFSKVVYTIQLPENAVLAEAVLVDGNRKVDDANVNPDSHIATVTCSAIALKPLVTGGDIYSYNATVKLRLKFKKLSAVKNGDLIHITINDPNNPTDNTYTQYYYVSDDPSSPTKSIKENTIDGSCTYDVMYKVDIG